MVGLYQLNTDRLCHTQSESFTEEEYQWSVFLCCLDVSYCMRCLIYWDKFQGAGQRDGEDGGVWERTLWRYWRCWSEEEDMKQYDLNKHFHRYCHCDTDTDCESLLSDQDSTELEDFESTFDRDMLTHFTEIDDQLDIVTASEYLDLLMQWLTATNIQLLQAAEEDEKGDYYENHKAWADKVKWCVCQSVLVILEINPNCLTSSSPSLGLAPELQGCELVLAAL